MADASQVLAVFKPGVPMTGREVSELFGVTASAATSQLRRLRDAGYLVGDKTESAGRMGTPPVAYRLPDEPMAPLAPRSWPEERLALVKKLWVTDGLSANEIAKRLGDVTRNAVIGQLSRMGLSRSTDAKDVSMKLGAVNGKKRLAPPGIRLGPGFSNTEKAPTPATAKAFQPLPGSTPRPLVEMAPGLCRWPLEIDGEHFACCQPAGEHRGTWRYCAAHTALAASKAPPSASKAMASADIGHWHRKRAA